MVDCSFEFEFRIVAPNGDLIEHTLPSCSRVGSTFAYRICLCERKAKGIHPVPDRDFKFLSSFLAGEMKDEKMAKGKNEKDPERDSLPMDSKELQKWTRHLYLHTYACLPSTGLNE